MLLFVIAGAMAHANSWHVFFQFDDEHSIMQWWVKDICSAHSIWARDVKTRFLPYLSFAINCFFCKENVIRASERKYLWVIPDEPSEQVQIRLSDIKNPYLYCESEMPIKIIGFKENSGEKDGWWSR